MTYGNQLPPSRWRADRSVIGDPEATADGNIVVPVGHMNLDGSGWEKSEHVVLTPEEARELAREVDRLLDQSSVPTTFTVEAVAAIVEREVLADEAKGTIPIAPDFGTLHSFVDANEYLIDAHTELGVELDSGSQPQADVVNAALDLVSSRMHARFVAHHKKERG